MSTPSALAAFMNSRLFIRCSLSASSQPPNLRLDQRPAFRSQLFLSDRIDTGKPGAEGRLVDFVEHEAPPDKIVAQAGVERGLVLALLADIFGDVALDHALDVVGQRFP